MLVSQSQDILGQRTVRRGVHEGDLWRSALALFDPDQHAAAVDIGDLQRHHLRYPEPGGVGGHQRRPVLQVRHRCQKPHYLIRAQDHRQLPLLGRKLLLDIQAGHLRLLLPRQRSPSASVRGGVRFQVQQPHRTWGR
jgi:hypothetical protein